MQNLDVISVNIWAILASLANLLILTLIVKRFLFKPVKKIVDARRAAIDNDYAQAKAALDEAEESRQNYEAAMAAAKQTSDQIIAEASRTAEYRSNEIVAEARQKATDIRKQAEADAGPLPGDLPGEVVGGKHRRHDAHGAIRLFSCVFSAAGRETQGKGQQQQEAKTSFHRLAPI